MNKFDICIIGSGAGAGPIAYELAKSGAKIVVIEKGEFYQRDDFSKDEIAYTKRSVVTPSLKDEFHTLVDGEDEYTTFQANWDFWNGSVVGGASNFMSGFFHRLHPDDFQLKSKFGNIKDANIEDWPISYEELEPYYDKVEKIVGVSGYPSIHKYNEPRSSKNFPYKPTTEHPISKLIDKSCEKLSINSVVTPRAILSKDIKNRNQCYYSNYCGSYGCSSGAKGSAREALINPALKTGNVTILTNAFVTKLDEKNNKIISASYIDKNTNTTKRINAKIFILAAQAVESSRLLLNSTTKNYPNGIANNNGQVGKNLLFSAGGIVTGIFDENSKISLDELLVEGHFVNRVIKDWYFLDEKTKGGIFEFLFEHANPISKANRQKWDNNDKLVWGKELYKKLEQKFLKEKQLNIEIFNDWIPWDNCHVSIDKKRVDKYGINIAKIAINSHPKNEEVGEALAIPAVKILKEMGARDIHKNISPAPPQNLQAGGCRFGNDPKKSVLNKYCQSHEISNLFVTDGSFMPTGGSVPYTFTIYANSFRVAEYLVNNWKKISEG